MSSAPRRRERRGGLQAHAVAGASGDTIRCQQLPAVGVAPADAIGHPQRLDGVGARDQGVVGQCQKAELTECSQLHARHRQRSITRSLVGREQQVRIMP